jgi:alpha-mannosidase
MNLTKQSLLPRALTIALLGFACASGLRAEAAETVLWTIGKVDNSTREFNDKWDFAANANPEFVVGKSDPQKDWSGFHPGSRDETDGSRPHPFVISFDLSNSPAGVFYLRLDLLFKSAGVPQYVVEINGHKGKFFPKPTLSDEIGDPETAWNIVFSYQHLVLALPASYFQQGSNRLVLTCLDDNSEPLLGRNNPTGGESGVYYDALQLANDPQATPSTAVDADAVPTIFYRHSDSGLRELVTLKASSMHPLQHGSATLTLTGHPYSCNLNSDYEFGEAACSVQVPEFKDTVSAHLAIQAGNAAAQKDLQLAAGRKWKLFLAPQIHLDMGYTDYRPMSYEVHSRSMDGIVAALEKNKSLKFDPDGAFIYTDYWENRVPEMRDRVLALLRENRLSLPAQLFTINSGLASQEELFRLFYASAQFSKSNGIPIKYANQTDVPAHNWAMPSYLQAIGVQYFAISSNPFRGAIIPNGRMTAQSPFWWEGPDGARVLTWFSRQYEQFESLFTKSSSEAAGINSLPIFLQTYSSAEYAPDAVLVYGTQVDNRPFLATELNFPEQWNRDFAFPSIRVVTMDEFFKYVEQNFGSSLHTLRGDGGAWWEEMAASNAHFAAQARRAKERALAAEKFAALAGAVDPDIRYPIETDDRIWQNLLFYTEHTWGAPATWRRPESDQAMILRHDKEFFTEDAANDVDSMLRRGMSQIADKLNLRGSTLVAFNSLSWPRSGEIETDIPRGNTLVDMESGKPIELELLRHMPDEEYDRVRFRAVDVPALGYRCYDMVPHGSTPERAKDEAIATTIESRYYRVTVDPARGGIASIYDKTLNKELVDASSPYALDQYVYAGYGHEGDDLIQQRVAGNTSLLQISPPLPVADLKISTAQRGSITKVEKTPWGTEMVMTSSAAHTPAIRTEVRLFDDERKIQIWNHIEKDAVKAPEGVYFAFPFAATPARVRYESLNTWIDPEKDQLPGANKEWFAAQHWVSVSSPEATIGLTLDEAPLLTLGDINRGLWPKTLKIQNGSVFSYIMNNYDGDDERPFQGGSFDFHYSITSDSTFQPDRLARFSREETSPLESEQINDMDKQVWSNEPLPAASGSFLKIDNPHVILATWKGAEDGRGAILRFYNTDESQAEAHVQFTNLRFKASYSTNAVENEEHALGSASTGDSLSLSLKAHEIRTVRLVGLGLQNNK